MHILSDAQVVAAVVRECNPMYQFDYEWKNKNLKIKSKDKPLQVQGERPETIRRHTVHRHWKAPPWVRAYCWASYSLVIERDTIRQSNQYRGSWKQQPVVWTDSVCYYSVVPERLWGCFVTGSAPLACFCSVWEKNWPFVGKVYTQCNTGECRSE